MRESAEVVVTASSPEQAQAQTRESRRASLEELARRQGVRPIRSADDLAADVFDTDEELDDFLAHVAAWRRADLA